MNARVLATIITYPPGYNVNSVCEVCDTGEIHQTFTMAVGGFTLICNNSHCKLSEQVRLNATSVKLVTGPAMLEGK